MNIRITSKFRPFSFDELLKPMAIYKEAYDKAEEDYNSLAVQTEQWKDVANRTQSPKAYAIFHKYEDALNKAADDFSRGMTLQTGNQLLNLKRRYTSDIMPIGKAATRKRELMEEQRKLELQDPRFWQRKAADISIDELMENPDVTYGNSYSKKALTSEAAAIAQNLSKGLIKYGKGMPVDEYTNTFIKHSGLQPSDIQDYLEGKPSAVSSMLQRIHNQVLSTSGIDTWGDKLTKAQATEAINKGMWSAIGESTVQTIDNYGARKALELANQKALFDYQNSQQSPDLLPIDERDLYSPIEISPTEVDADMKHFGQYFYTGKDGKTYMNNAGLKRYKQELEATKRKGKTATRDLTGAPIDINIPTDFYNFIKKLGADKYIGKGREWRPGTIGNLWSNYTKNGKINSPQGDALREVYYNVKVDPTNQKNLMQSIIESNKNRDFSIVEYDSKNQSFKHKKSISGKDLAKGKYIPTNIQGSYAGINISMTDEDNNTITIKAPADLFHVNQEQALSAYKASRNYAIRAKNAKDKLKLGSINDAINAYSTGIINGKPITEQQKELIRQWYDAEKEHTKHVQIGQQQLTQLSQSNQTKPTEYNAVGF